MNDLQQFEYNTFDIQQNLFFSLGANKYAIPLKNVVEVMKLPALDYPQKLPNNIIGILKYNNLVINVVDIRFYLDIQVSEYSINNKLIVVKTDESIFGVIADDIENIMNFENAKIERLPYISETKIIDSLYHVDEHSISILNMFAIEQLLRQNTQNNTSYDVTTLFPTDEKSVEIFQKRAQYLITKLNDTINQVSFANDKFILFALNETNYCIDLKYVKEVTNKTNTIKLPCSPEYIEGLMSIRGDFITVINLKKFLNLKNTSYNKKTKVIIINSNECKIGLLVDEIYDISEISDEYIFPKKSSSEDSYIQAEVIQNNDIKLVLNMDKIMSDEKMFINEDE